MAGGNFATANETFRSLLGNGIKFIVPPFQRDYSWEEEQWEDLWLDIMAVYRDKEEEGHYMGYLVLQNKDSRNYQIIDGQQRLTTISLIILAVLKQIKKLIDEGRNTEDNEIRFKLLKNTYIGFTDPVSLISETKLEMNRHNNDYYRNYLIPFKDEYRRNLSYSNKLLKKAFDWYFIRIKKEILEEGEELANFLEKLSDILFFTKITVTDELNAFKVFETLNARGVKLSSTDLLKNYFFSIIGTEKENELELSELEKRWNDLIDTLGSERFPEFLRIFWNSFNQTVRKTNLFKTIKKSITTRSGVFELMEEMYIFFNSRDNGRMNPDQAKTLWQID
jgi:uncharacterized protein with ParB-like and HNH nuclease domain